MHIDITVKGPGSLVHVIVDGKRYANIRAGQEVIWPQNQSIAFYSTMIEAVKTMRLDLYPRADRENV